MKAKPRRDNKSKEETIREARKTNADELTTLTFQVPKSLHNEFRGITGFRGEKMKDVISDLMQQYVETHK